jgi:hypothetical protein
MNTVSLEAFEHSLRGKRSVWIVSSIGFPPGFSELIHSEMPHFQRKVLLCSPQTQDAWRLLDSWDSILCIQNNQDWSLALTHVLYQPNPSLICIAPELKTPTALFQKTQNKQTIVQFVHLSTHPFDRTLLNADAVIFPYIKSPTDSEIDTLYAILQQTTTEHAKQTKQVFKDILRDTRAAQASVLISSLGEQLGKANLYWYYATLKDKTPKEESLSLLLNTLVSRYVGV